MYKSSPTFLYSLLDVLAVVSEEAADSFTLSVYSSTSPCVSVMSLQQRFFLGLPLVRWSPPKFSNAFPQPESKIMACEGLGSNRILLLMVEASETHKPEFKDQHHCFPVCELEELA